MNIDERQYKKMADPQIGPDPSVGSSPAFIRARLALASSYVKNAFTSPFLFAIQIPLAIRSSHIKQKKNRITAILSLAGGDEGSRTPVQKACPINLSECSSLF